MPHKHLPHPSNLCRRLPPGVPGSLPAPLLSQPVLSACMLVSLIAFAVVIMDHHKLVAGAVFGGLACVAVYGDLVSRGITPSYCIGYLIVASFVGKFVFLILGSMGIVSGGNGVQFSLMVKPWLMLLYMNLPLLVLWALARVLYRGYRARVAAAFFATEIENDRRCMEWLMVAALPLVFGQTIGTFAPDFLRYPLDVVGSAMSCVPFFVGRFIPRTSFAFWLWAVALGTNGLIMIMMGGRFAALFPLMVFAIGVASSLPVRVKRFILVFFLLGSVPGLWVVGLLGILRDELGRDTTELVSGSHFDRMFTLAQQVEVSQDVFTSGVGRMVPWANYAPVVLTPDVIPYRGLFTLPEECLTSVSIYAFSPKTAMRRVDLKMGTLAATDYGYLVNEQTSVEWGTIADGWSRGGWWSAILFLTIAYGAGLAVERWCLISNLFRPAIKIFLISFLMGRILRSGAVPLLDHLRGVAIYLAVLLVGLWLLNHLIGGLFPRKPTVQTGRSGKI